MHVSLKEKCKLSWDRVFRACKSLDAARGQQLPRGRVGGGGGGGWEQMKLPQQCPWRRTEKTRGVKNASQQQGAVFRNGGGGRRGFVDGNTGSGSA